MSRCLLTVVLAASLPLTWLTVACEGTLVRPPDASPRRDARGEDVSSPPPTDSGDEQDAAAPVDAPEPTDSPPSIDAPVDALADAPVDAPEPTDSPPSIDAPVADAGSPDAGHSLDSGGPILDSGPSVECMAASDCTTCAYGSAPTSASECYCVLCPYSVMSVLECEANADAWADKCSLWRRTHPCPIASCIRPGPVDCRADTCVATDPPPTY